MKQLLFALCLALVSANAHAQEIVVGTADPAVKFTAAGVSLLVSQIGYSVSGERVAYLVSADKALGDAIASYAIEDEGGASVATGEPEYVGEWVTAHFWKLDLSELNTVGTYRLKAGALASQAFDVREPKALYFDPVYDGMMFGQMALRLRTDALAGFIDCGSDIRETNSHVTQMSGMLDMLELHPDWFSADQKTEAEDLLTHFREFFEGQQDALSGRVLGGFWTGSQLTAGEWPNHLLGTYGFLRLARHYHGVDSALEADMLQRAQQAIDYIDTNLAVSGRLATYLTMELLIEAEFHAQTDDAAALAKAKEIAQELRARQVTAEAPTPSGLYGLFTDPDASFSRLNYHVPGDLNGEYWGLPLTGLVTLAELHPDDPDAPMWSSMLTDYVEGTLKKTSEMSPMGLVANGEYDGVRWFSDLFHGMSMTYGVVAAQTVRYARFLDDSSLYAIAEKQLLWVGGLNTGTNFPAAPEPFSCIVGQGYQWLNDGHGEFANIPGSIVNGLSATPQFQRQMPPGAEQPAYLCNESWISHTGGWLSGTAELLSNPPMVLDDAGAPGGTDAGSDAAADASTTGGTGGGTSSDAGMNPDAAGTASSVAGAEKANSSSGCSCRTSSKDGSDWRGLLLLGLAGLVGMRRRSGKARREPTA